MTDADNEHRTLLDQIRLVGVDDTSRQQRATIEKALADGKMHPADRVVFSGWLDSIKKDPALVRSPAQMRLLRTTLVSTWTGEKRLTKDDAHLPDWMRDPSLLKKSPPRKA